MRNIGILGSTGSIGTQALEVIEENKERFNVTALACGLNTELFSKQIEKFDPELCVCMREEDALELSKKFPKVEFSWGEQGLIDLVKGSSDLIINSLMGIKGFIPTYEAILAGKDIALANKETLVAGGRVIMEERAAKGVELLPIDSEHSAIFQCLQGNSGKDVKRILLTASGGPFRGWSSEKLESVTPEMALKHPNWSMGRKITIDSATLMNKGLEMIEARWLFDVSMDDIEVIVHPQSVIHSAVEFKDTSILAQMGIPDMKVPISVAIGYPDRLKTSFPSLDLFDLPNGLTFEKPDMDAFRCLPLAIRSSKEGGTYPAVMNGANEVLVQAFLDGKIGFTDIPKFIEEALDSHSSIENPTAEEIVAVDRETRERIEKDVIC